VTGIEWRPIPGYEGFYEASCRGYIRSIPRLRLDGAKLPGQNLVGTPNGSGYLTVCLSRNGHKRRVAVHRLVALTFLAESYFEGADACHNDGVKTNNWVGNLRWDTRSANIIDAVRHGTHHNGSKTECVHGHRYTEENIIKSRGGRNCRECRRDKRFRPTPDTAHGTIGGYNNWYCRCRPCTDAYSARRSENKRRKAARA
jgi:hypothetical protein